MDHNAERLEHLRQIVADNYDPATATPEKWADWFVEQADGAIGSDEYHALLKAAEQKEDAYKN